MRTIHQSIVVVAWLLVLNLTGCCRDAPKDGEPEATSSAPTPKKDPGGDDDSILTAGVKFGTVFCTEREGSECPTPATSFPANTPIIHVIHRTKNVPKADQTVNIKWIAEDVGSAAPKNHVVFDLNQSTKGDLLLGVATHYTISSQAKKPTKGWPVGKYRVEIRIADKMESTAPFTITAAE